MLDHRLIRAAFVVSAVIAVGLLFNFAATDIGRAIAFGFACWCGGIAALHLWQHYRSTT